MLDPPAPVNSQTAPSIDERGVEIEVPVEKPAECCETETRRGWPQTNGGSLMKLDPGEGTHRLASKSVDPSKRKTRETVLRHRRGAGADFAYAIVLGGKCQQASDRYLHSFAKQTLARNLVVDAAERHCRLRFQ